MSSAGNYFPIHFHTHTHTHTLIFITYCLDREAKEKQNKPIIYYYWNLFVYSSRLFSLSRIAAGCLSVLLLFFLHALHLSLRPCVHLQVLLIFMLMIFATITTGIQNTYLPIPYAYRGSYN